MNTFFKLTVSFVFFGLFLAACTSPPAAIPTITSAPPSPSPLMPSSTSPLPTATQLSPTATSIPPVNTPVTPKPQPTETQIITETIATNAEDIIGIWRTNYEPVGGRAYIQYLPDGKWKIAKTIERLERPAMRGTYRFEGEVFITYDDDCGTGKYTVHLQYANGLLIGLRFSKIEDTCKPRSRDLFAGMKSAQP